MGELTPCPDCGCTCSHSSECIRNQLKAHSTCRAEFHAVLMELAKQMDHMRDIKDNPIRYAAVTQMIIEINKAATKYAPT